MDTTCWIASSFWVRSSLWLSSICKILLFYWWLLESGRVPAPTTKTAKPVKFTSQIDGSLRLDLTGHRESGPACKLGLKMVHSNKWCVSFEWRRMNRWTTSFISWNIIWKAIRVIGLLLAISWEKEQKQHKLPNCLLQYLHESKFTAFSGREDIPNKLSNWNEKKNMLRPAAAPFRIIFIYVENSWKKPVSLYSSITVRASMWLHGSQWHAITWKCHFFGKIVNFMFSFNWLT